jgi:DNA invertase Pin-like site-specific DNA recombinase
MMNDKISAKHLERAAYVYIRQSTLQQVRHNLESSRRQYALQGRARELGFQEVVVIDEDLGTSGAGHQERPGFGRLLAAVCDGRVGAVLAMEASRLARNNRDWHHLIDLCMLTQTLVVDAEGVYDPRLLNDRLLLGLKGTMSEFELGILRQRAQEAYRQKVVRGEVLTIVPVGFIRSHSNRIEITPDREVQEAVRRVFGDFERFGTLRQVLLWYHQENVTIPVARAGEGGRPTVWRLPNYQHLLRMLKNPTYAGAFAYGRTQCQTMVVEGRSRKRGGHRVAMENWQVLLKDHHPGYISWEQYLENQRILKSNRTKSHDVSSGAAKKGSALLSGLLRCARCGHKLHVAYRSREAKSPRYYCLTGNKEQGAPSCLCFAAYKVEQAVVERVLEACQPMGIEASLQVLNAQSIEHDQKKRRLELALERVRYEAEHAQRQYEAVDPCNRLVAAELEARWNRALSDLADAEARLNAHQQSQLTLSEEDRNRLLELGANLNAAWNDASAPIELKKRIIRTLINEIVIDINHPRATIEMQIHWAGGVHTPLIVRKNKHGRNSRAVDRDVVELVRELALVQPDSGIASTLNRLGYQSGTGKTWNETRVKSLRNYNQIPVFARGTDRPWLTLEEAAATLKTGVTVVRTMIRKELLAARQVAKHAPWTIRREDLERPEIRNYVKATRPGRPFQYTNDKQTILPNL